MTIFKKYSGTYIEVIDALGLERDFYKAEESKQKFDEQITKDLTRISYFNTQDTVDEQKKRLQDSTHLVCSVAQDNEKTHTLKCESKPLSYTQGNFHAAIFSYFVINQYKCNPAMVYIASEGTREGFCDDISVTYVDDAGLLCGFSVTQIREDFETAANNQESDTPLEDRNHLFAVTHIKNVTAAPVDRTVTCWFHPGLLPSAKTVDGGDINDVDVPSDIDRLLNSAHLSTVLKGLFNGEQVSMLHFDALKTRLNPNRNFDNRDFKMQLLNKLLSMEAALGENNEVKNYIESIWTRLKTDIDFFRDDNFDATINAMKELFILNVKGNDDAQREHIQLKIECNFLKIKHELAHEKITDSNSPQEKKELFFIQGYQEAIANISKDTSLLNTTPSNITEEIEAKFKKHIESKRKDLICKLENLKSLDEAYLKRASKPHLQAAIAYRAKKYGEEIETLPEDELIFNYSPEKVTGKIRSEYVKKLNDEATKRKREFFATNQPNAPVVPDKPKNYDTIASKRIGKTFLFGVICLALVVGAVLTLTGVFAVIGVAVMTGTAAIAGWAGTGVVFVAGAACAAKIVISERKFSRDLDAYAADTESYHVKARKYNADLTENEAKYVESEKLLKDCGNEALKLLEEKHEEDTPNEQDREHQDHFMRRASKKTDRMPDGPFSHGGYGPLFKKEEKEEEEEEEKDQEQKPQIL